MVFSRRKDRVKKEEAMQGAASRQRMAETMVVGRDTKHPLVLQRQCIEGVEVYTTTDEDTRGLDEYFRQLMMGAGAPPRRRWWFSSHFGR